MHSRLRAGHILACAMLLAGPAEAQTKACAGVAAMVAGKPECLRPKDSFRDCPECPELVVVPAGSYEMGSPKSSDELPIRQILLARPFAVGKFETTFAEWDACIAEGACRHAPGDQGWGRGTRPVINVSWNDVTREYLPWLSRKTGRRYRLLSEAEWEYVARAGSRSTYSWGEDIGSGRANCDRCGSAWDNRQTAPVGSFAPNAFGLHDLHGNVWEWTQDCYAPSHAGTPASGRPRMSADCKAHVVRGGGWNDRPIYLRASIRYGDPPTYRGAYVGFRVARGL
jgi:formylglycine-generating enzyme required for sulfatase activity